MGWVIRDPRMIWLGGGLDPRGSVIRGPPTTPCPMMTKSTLLLFAALNDVFQKHVLPYVRRSDGCTSSTTRFGETTFFNKATPSKSRQIDCLGCVNISSSLVARGGGRNNTTIHTSQTCNMHTHLGLSSLSFCHYLSLSVVSASSPKMHLRTELKYCATVMLMALIFALRYVALDDAPEATSGI